MFRSVTSSILAASLLAACGNDNNLLEIGPRLRTSPALRSFDTCDELETTLRENLKEEMRVQMLQYLDDDWFGMTFLDGASDARSANESGGRQEGVNYSGTNNQESGVDEADLVKTDGTFIYVLGGDRLEIMGVPRIGELEHLSTTILEGWTNQMLLSGDRAVVYSFISSWDLPDNHPLRQHAGAVAREWGIWYRVPVFTKITVLDLSADRRQPKVLRELYLEGWYQTARKVDSTVRMVSYAYLEIDGLQQWIDLPDSAYGPFGPSEGAVRHAVREAILHNNAVIDSTPLSDFVPQIYERFADGTIQEHPFTRKGCTQFAVADDGTGRGFTSILSLDLETAELAFDDDHILTNYSQVYASLDTLIISEWANDWWWYWRNDDFDEATNLHRFDISQAGIATYTGSGRIPGTVLNQFAISEHEGDVRVASCTGEWNRWWLEDSEESENHVFVLRGSAELEVVGHAGGIGIGERIWSVRFDGDKAYLVTFRQIDPLWTVDMSNPAAPQIIGELEVPGVSTYIHPLEGGHLLTIGFGGDDAGLDWSTRISLFDVTDFAAPALDDAMSLGMPSGSGWANAWSEATYEHKAFQYWAPLQLLAVPVTAWRRSSYDWEYYSRLEIIHVDAQDGLTRYGTVDHSDFYNSQSDDWWYWTDVRRSIFMHDAAAGDFIYAISDRGVTAHDLSDMSLAASVPLAGTPNYHGWY